MKYFLALVLFAASQQLIYAQNYTNYTWNGAGSNDNWSTATNWNTLPVSGVGSSIILQGSSRTNPNNDLGIFTLSRLRAENLSASGFTLTGQPLNFVQTSDSFNPVIEFEGGSGVGGLRLNNGINVVNTTLNLNIEAQISNAIRYEVILGGPITGNGTISRAQSSPGTEVAITGFNSSFEGTYTNRDLTWLANANALGRMAAINTGISTTDTIAFGSGLSSQGLTVRGYNQQIGSIAGNGTLQIGLPSSAAIGLIGFRNQNEIYSGLIEMTNDGSEFAKVGTGTLTLTNRNGGIDPGSNLRGTVSVRGGALVVSGTNGSLGTVNSNPTTALNVSVYNGSELRLFTGSSNNSKLQNNAAVFLNGGTLRLDATGGNTGSDFSEIVGALNIGAGQSTIRIDAATNRGQELRFASLANANSNTGTLQFLSNSLGVNALTTAGSANVFFAAAPTLIGQSTSYTTNATNLGVVAFATTGTVTGGVPTTFVTFDATGDRGVRGLLDTNYASTFADVNSNVSLNSTLNLSANSTTNALRLTSGGSLNVGTNNLTITSGAFLNTSGGDISGTGQIRFGAAADRTAYITNNAAMNFAAPIAAANFSKNGAGQLTLSNTVTLQTSAGNGNVAINAGTLVMGAGSSFANASNFQVSRGGTFNVSATGLTLGANQSLVGNGAVVGQITTQADSVLRPTSLGGPATGQSAPGQLTVQNLNLQGGRYIWNLNSIHDGEYTQSHIQGSGILNLSSLNSSNRFTIAIESQQLNNTAGEVYDFDRTQPYTWVIATFDGGITGFTSDQFAVDISQFQNALQGGDVFQVSQLGNNLVLQFQPVPEPATILAFAAAVVGLNHLRRRRHKQACQVDAQAITV